MGRPPTRSITLKDGFYIEITPKFGGAGIKLRRETEDKAKILMKMYEKTKNVKYLGEVKSGKFV